MSAGRAPSLSGFLSDARGAIALNLGLSLPALMFMVGIGVDYANLIRQKAQLQHLADAAAISSARELRIGVSSGSTVGAVAQNVVTAGLVNTKEAGPVSIATELQDHGAAVSVTLGQDVPSLFGGLLSALPTRVTATATARMKGGAPICVIALNPSASKALSLDKNARMTGYNCAIYSDSSSQNGIGVKDSAAVTAALICSSGGIASGSSGMSPQPQTDCPAIPDPLAARAQPTVGACTQTDLVIVGGTRSLNPGVYCGGLQITAGASVQANPGVFIIKDGELKVDGDSSLTGTGVGFFFTGAGAGINFAKGANTVSLSAPESGAMAGLLFFEDRTVAPGQKHQIYSNNARQLLGTVYLPRGRFYVASSAPVADQSAYTVVVADMIELSEGPNLVLNTDYGSTTVPVPEGLGPGAVILQK